MDYPGGPPTKLLAWEFGRDAYVQADWSPDGRLVICRSGGFVAPRGFFIQPLNPPAPGFFLEWKGRKISGQNPVWSSQPSGIIFASDTELESGANLEFAPLDAAGRVVGPTSRLTTAADDFPVITRDGRRLAYTSGLSSNSDIWKIRVSTATGLPVGEAARVTRGPAADEAPAVLPDNQHLLFISDRDGGFYLYVSDLDGGNVKLVDRSHDWQYVDAVSPDGRWLVLTERMAGGRVLGNYLLLFDTVTLEAAGPARLLGDVSNRSFSFSPDGKYLLRIDPRGAAILAWENPASSAPREVRWPLRAEFLKEYPVQINLYFSPDGAWVVFGAYKERHKAAVFVVRRGSDTPRLVWEGSGYPFWNNDPRRIYIWSERYDDSGERLGFVEFDPATGATGSFQLIDLQPMHGTTDVHSYWLTPDRRWLFYARWEHEGDIFVADLVQN